MGDFNEVITTEEINGGDFPWDSGMQDFKDCIDSIFVEDLRAVGAFHTWWNSQDNSPTYKKLDRVLVNDTWLHNLTNSEVNFVPQNLSDHCPAILYTGLKMSHIPKPFQFFNYIIELDNFIKVVKKAWDTPCDGPPLQILSDKLKCVKKALIDLNKTVGNLTTNVQSSRQLLYDVQNALVDNPRNYELLSLQRKYTDDLWKALLHEENLLKQKSRVLWLKEGDRNSSFLHNQIKSRWNHNKILSIENEEGKLKQGHNEVQEVAVNYFADLLGKPYPTPYEGLPSLGITFDKTISPQ